MYEEYLAHYGVLGMKWGVRKDRPSTGRSQKRIQKAKKQLSRNRKMAAKKANRLAKRKKRILSSPKRTYRHMDQLTEKEITDAIKKFNWQKQLRNLSNSRVSAGKRFITGLSNTEKSVTSLIAQAKALNKVTGGVLFNYADQQLSKIQVYRQIQDKIEPLINKKDD